MYNTLGIVCFHLNLQPYHHSLLAEHLSKLQKKFSYLWQLTISVILVVQFGLLILLYPIKFYFLK